MREETNVVLKDKRKAEIILQWIVICIREGENAVFIMKGRLREETILF